MATKKHAVHVRVTVNPGPTTEPKDADGLNGPSPGGPALGGPPV